ncbi:MAG TPA: peptide-methionine (S)-S-oxide reductase MsrA [candidate division Zixibacteria bacterium]|nr:peptide-methionine (S)-S-oxide reductase MsrA [candidate division Zixibacteria bacterium]
MKEKIISRRTETATLGGGCFWCLEAIYQNVKGVSLVVSGYAGGSVDNPRYQAVCSGTTGHAEVMQITFDPDVISYDNILYIFWRMHDPTTPNRQGADVGTQYRSIIFYHDETQQEIAEHSRKQADASDLWDSAIVTEVVPLTRFYPAEDYHQNYYRNNPRQPYCTMVIDPKVDKFKKSFQDMMT